LTDPQQDSGTGMSAWDAICSRRNVREFADRPIAAADLDQILEAGRRAPSSQNWQPWDFILVTSREQLAELATLWQGAGHLAGSAAAIALILPTAEDTSGRAARRANFDLGQATMSMMLAAAALGIGSCHAGVGDQDRARQLLGFPGDRHCPMLISLGYPAGRPLAPLRRPNRRPFDDVVHRGRW
jgi:nitroreductase